MSKYKSLEKYEYLDYSAKGLGIDGIIKVLNDMHGEKMVKQLNLRLYR